MANRNIMEETTGGLYVSFFTPSWGDGDSIAILFGWQSTEMLKAAMSIGRQAADEVREAVAGGGDYTPALRRLEHAYDVYRTIVTHCGVPHAAAEAAWDDVVYRDAAPADAVLDLGL